ncbi:MAG: hypothetical protein OXC67_08570 [Flavobacteriaceae bacterium]|nr:hypothetical protein [Flavobacteriaceae bacterium]
MFNWKEGKRVMILPHPESNLKLNILVLGAEIIKIMNKRKFKGKYNLVDDVMSEFLNEDKDRSPDLFLYAVTLLHIIGSIKKNGYKIRLLKDGKHSIPNLFENVD